MTLPKNIMKESTMERHYLFLAGGLQGALPKRLGISIANRQSPIGNQRRVWLRPSGRAVLPAVLTGSLKTAQGYVPAWDIADSTRQSLRQPTN